MVEIWKRKHPGSDINEQRLMDQRRFIIWSKVFSELELQELEKVAKPTQDNDHNMEDKCRVEVGTIVEENVSIEEQLMGQPRDYELTEWQTSLRGKNCNPYEPEHRKPKAPQFAPIAN